MARRRLIQMVLQPYWRLTRGLTLGAQGVVIDAHDRVLLVRHTYRPGWHFPGGGVEPGETADLSLRRELEEEAGVIVEETPQLLGLYANFEVFPRDHIALFVVRKWRRPRIPPPNTEIAEQGFFAPDALPEGIAKGAARRMDEIFRATPRLDTW